MKSERGAHDIGNRIHGAHFVKMDLLDRHLVHGRLGFTQTAEDGRGVAFHWLRQRGRADHIQDVAQVAMMVVVCMSFIHHELMRSDAAPNHPVEAKLSTGRERIEPVDQRLLIGTRRCQGAHQHVAAQS